jgi:aminoglycoside 3-N-acetyltransferase
MMHAPSDSTECQAALTQFTQGLRDAGLCAGAAALVHCSLRSLGHVPGGAETVIDALLQTLGPRGTLLMCAHSYATVTPSQPVFDARHTPSCVGLVPEVFRQRPGVRRSLHPTHSVCGQGPDADELLGAHDLDQTPAGPNSPYHRLRQIRGLIVMLGCGLKPNTSMHGVEELVEPPYLFMDERVTFELRDADGRQRTASHRVHNFKGWRQRYDRVDQVLHDEQELRKARVLNAEVCIIDAEALWHKAAAKLREDPLFFVDRAE